MTSSAKSSAMTVALRQPMTLDQFLAWEEQQELRYEFDGIGPVARVGGTAEHDRISLNLAASLVVRLRGKLCRRAPHASPRDRAVHPVQPSAPKG